MEVKVLPTVSAFHARSSGACSPRQPRRATRAVTTQCSATATLDCLRPRRFAVVVVPHLILVIRVLSGFVQRRGKRLEVTANHRDLAEAPREQHQLVSAHA